MTCVGLLALSLITLLPRPLLAGIALLRDATGVKVVTLRGDTPVKLAPVTPSTDVFLVVLCDTLAPGDAQRIRREIPAVFNNTFLHDDALHLVTVVGTGGESSAELTSSTQLQLALKHVPETGAGNVAAVDLLNTLGGVASILSGNWSNAILIGRLPAITADDLWASAWLGEVYRRQKVRLSFWSLDSSAPSWARSTASAALGAVSTSSATDLIAALGDDPVLFEATWNDALAKGAWPYQTELKNAAGTTLASFPAVAAAPNFLPPLKAYLAARANMLAAPAFDEGSTRATLELNPSDADALNRLAASLDAQSKPKDSASAWRVLSELKPGDGIVWAHLGTALYATGDFDSSAKALDRAVELGVKNRELLEERASIHVRHRDFAKALPLVEEALAGQTGQADKSGQSLWLLRADCARELKRWPMEAESLEHAAAVGTLAFDRSTRLIEGYLEAKEPARAVAWLRKASDSLPRDAGVRVQYAQYWEAVHDGSSAQPLWESALEADPRFEPAYLGLIKHHLEGHHAADALRISEAGLKVIPNSMPLVIAEETALENLGEVYGARRLFNERCSGTHDVDVLKRQAFLEDTYGSGGAEAYAARLDMMVKNDAPQIEVVELCRRGLIVALRDEHLDTAKIFADKLATAGDRSGQDLLQLRKSASSSTIELPGGVDAFNFLLFGGGKNRPDRILLDYSRMLSSLAPESHDSAGYRNWLFVGARVHDYFRIVSALMALGEKKNDHFEIELTNANKAGKQRTEKVFSILGLKLKSGKEGLELKSAEGKSEARKQDTLAALAIDDAGIQEALAAGRSYRLEIPVDTLPLFPSKDFWEGVIGEKDHSPGGLAEALVSDMRVARLFYALNSMDRATASLMVRSISIRNLEERYCLPLSYYSAALAVHGDRAEIPGGAQASAAWERLTGVSPANAIPFFESLLSKDDGRAIAYFHELSQLDLQHQRFFTRSPERLKRFYDLFRESAEMRRGGEHRINGGSFAEFLREVPLNDDLTVDFPGSAEVWMVAKGRRATASSVQNLNRKLKRAVAPGDEDDILARLATSGYKSREGEQSELINFIATAHIDAERTEPLTPDAALLLAQGYADYHGMYPYFTELGELETADYQKLFSLSDHIATFNVAFQNVSLGQIHVFLATLGLLHERGVAEKDLLAVYRQGVDRYADAKNPAAWVDASLKNVDDLTRLGGAKSASHDSAVAELLLGPSATEQRRKKFNQVLAIQKAPSLDALFTISANLNKVSTNPAALDEVQRQISAFVTIPLPQGWRLESEHKKCFDSYETAQALGLVAKIRDKQAKRKPNRVEIEELSDEVLGALEPWMQLALVSRVYARYLDPGDLLVSEDPMLIRKHEFIELDAHTGGRTVFTSSRLTVASVGEGSFFSGGLADFGVSAGQARAEGNHLGNNTAFATAVLSSIRATDWSSLGSTQLQSFGATVRLAREWIVRSATSQPARQTLEAETLGLLSLNRRHSLIDALEQRDWAAVWDAVSVSDLYFLGQSLLQNATANKDLQDVWSSPELSAMRQVALQQKDLDALGSVAPALNGCAKPRLRRYAPYEDYERYIMPERMAQRTAELKLYLAWIADNQAWQPGMLEDLSAAAADKLLGSVRARDLYDWSAVIEACKHLSTQNLEIAATQKQ